MRDLPTHTDAQRLGMADSYALSIGDACERYCVEGMIGEWQNGRERNWPSFGAQTLPMRQVARILRGEAIHLGAGALQATD